ncbi:MAG: GntP family permease [Planctomycetota bacterium]|jgi:H+/gluconate symporter-like permease
MDPLIILGVGIVTVVGMIIVLRVNAFVALITSAMLVSLMSAGELSEKIQRVADAFGGTAGNIGIVIALAAVIGKCLMDSGAADRIVRSFLKALGEKRASWALMGSGFVLAVPVFFDTVFYLLVPLARSLWRRTRKNYMLYILAIGVGGAITHTLVPPTPGPLLMAANLKIDIGMMIMFGAMIAAPTAVVGLLAAGVINRLMDVPMRPYSGQEEPEPIGDDQLPGLWISLLPVVLPVILISANTVTKMFADDEHTQLVRQGDVFDWAALAAELSTGTDEEAPAPVRRVWDLLPPDLQASVTDAAENGTVPSELQARVTQLVEDEEYDFRRDYAFSGVKISDEAARLEERVKRLSKKEGLSAKEKSELKLDQQDFRWLVLESAFPQQAKQTLRRRTASVTALFGNANLALLLSAAIAMWILLRQRGLTLGQLAKTAETALMSGGVIILITAAGGAFGAMLKEANIKETIDAAVGGQGQGMGLMMLCLGFVVAAVMKIAQGSSTVAMITTSGMLASMASPEMLECHPVYLAAAIGCGSLVGSWMNDSGFWIFARMSALTEVETLKAWSVLLVFVGFAGLGFTLLFASVIPMAG